MNPPPPTLRRRLALAVVALLALGLLGMFAAARLPRALHAARVCPRPAGDSTIATGKLPPSATTGLLLVANQQSASASIVDLATGVVTHVPAGEEPHDAAVSPDGRWGVVSDYGRRLDGHELIVIDMAGKRVARVIDLGEHLAPHDIAFLPGVSDRVVVTTQGSRHVVEVNIETGAVTAAVETRAGTSHSLTLAQDGRPLFTANEEAANLSRLDLATRRFVRHYPAGPRPEGLAITPDGREVWTGHQPGGLVKVLDVATGAVVATIPGFGTPDRIVMSPDGRRAAIPDWLCNAVHMADVPAAVRMVEACLPAVSPPAVS